MVCLERVRVRGPTNDKLSAVSSAEIAISELWQAVTSKENGIPLKRSFFWLHCVAGRNERTLEE